MKLTVLYDNNRHDPRLTTQWGFACLVEYGEHALLFDTGGDGPTLLGNMDILDIDVGNIQAVVLSHEHGDHIGGLGGLLQVHHDLTVYLPQAFSTSVRAQAEAAGANVVEITEPLEIMPGIHSTGQVSGTLIEQALVVESPRGLVVITGCAHPGIIRMVQAATQVAQDNLYLAIGGFHLGGSSQAAISDIIAAFERMGVQHVAPTHCSGDTARGLFAQAYGDRYVDAGVGWTMTITGEE